MTQESTHSLTALFAPGSVAIIGASDDPDRLSGRPVRYLLDGGFEGAIYPVNPKRDTVQGLKAYASVAALPETPDVALIVVPAKAAEEAVLDCARRGVRGVYLLSGGFAESGEAGERAQRDIQRIAREAGMRMLGPNCLGAFNASRRFFGTFASSLEDALPSPGPVGIVSQSGAYGQHLAYLVRRRGLGVQYLISTGNEIDVELSECIEWLAAQPEIAVVLAYAEGLRDGPRLMRALEAARRACKPVVFLKVGASEAGARAAASHTAALAGSDAVHDAVFRQFGAYRAASTDEQVDIAYACVKSRVPGPKVGVVTVSGGFGVQCADAAEREGLQITPLPAAAHERMAQLLPGGGWNNPIDVTGQAVNDVNLLSDTLALVTREGGYDALFVCLTTTSLAAALQSPIRAALVAATAAFRREKPVVLLMVAEPEVIAAYEAEGFLVFEDVVRAVKAVGALSYFQGAFEREADTAPAVPGLPGLPSGGLTEVEAKRVLQEAGVPVLQEALARTPDEAVRAAQLAGGPVAMKIVSPDILHKTEIGGVLLRIEGAAAVRQAFDTLMTRAATAVPGARIDGVLVSPMVGDGVETILGVAQDPTFGPVVMFGLGGVLAECFRDTALRAAPVGPAEARRMVEETRAAQMLRGWRGAPPADVDALIDAIVKLSQFAAFHGARLQGVDVNPFVVREKGRGGVALDAVVIGAGA